MTDKEAMAMALEFLEDNQHYIADNERHAYVMLYNDFITALKERLLPDPMRDVQRLGQEIEQEPVAWQVMVEDEAMKEFPIKDMAHDWCLHQKLSGSPHLYWIRPLYATHPPQRTWVGLTDEDWDEIFGNSLTIGAAIKNTEAKLRSKNT